MRVEFCAPAEAQGKRVRMCLSWCDQFWRGRSSREKNEDMRMRAARKVGLMVAVKGHVQRVATDMGGPSTRM